MHYDIANCLACGQPYPVQGLVYNSLCAVCDSMPEPDRTRTMFKAMAKISARDYGEPAPAPAPPATPPPAEFTRNSYANFFAVDKPFDAPAASQPSQTDPMRWPDLPWCEACVPKGHFHRVGVGKCYTPPPAARCRHLRKRKGMPVTKEGRCPICAAQGALL